MVPEIVNNTNSSSAAVNKSRPECERRRRRKQKNNNKAYLDETMDEEFRRIFKKFSFSDATDSDELDSEFEDEEENYNEVKEKLGISNKRKKLQRRMNIAELKRICSRPDVVEVWDVSASDSKLLVFLKSYRNTVPVPMHWSRKRKFLQGKIGFEKEPFQLPDFIAATGIIEKTRKKQKQSRLGKMEIDYKVLHDAFFKYQRKPKLSCVGEVYYEGKEFEVKFRREMKLKGGMFLSHELKEALGMLEVEGEGAPPPPWVVNMRRYGPPPSYAKYEEGETVDDTKHWGDLKEEEEEEEEDMEEEEEEIEANIQSIIDLRKQQRKMAERPLYYF